MSKRENHKAGRKQARRASEDNWAGGQEKMLGRQSRAHYGSGPSRQHARSIREAKREAFGCGD